MRSDVLRRCYLFILCSVVGCQGQSSPVTAPPVKSAPAAISNAGEATTAGKTPSENQPHPADPPPVAAVKSLLRDIDAGRWESLAEFLPASYVQQLESLWQSAVKKCPEEIWQRLHSLVKKTSQLAQQQPRLFAGESAGTQQQLKAVLSGLADDAAWDRSKWNDVNFKTLLRTASAQLTAGTQSGASSNSTLLSQTDVRLESQAGAVATLRLQSPLDQAAQSVEFVQIDGKWIPKSLSEAWPATIGQAVAWLDAASEETLTEVSQRLNPMLLQMDGTLDQMLRAERLEEVQLGWWQIQSLLMQARQELLQPGPPPQIELLLAETVSDEQLTDLLHRLIDVADHPESAEYLTIPTATGTIIQLSPVADFDKFVERLDFMTVKSADAKARRIEVAAPTGQ